VGQATQTAGDIAAKAQNTSYDPTKFDNQFKAPDKYQNTNFTSGTFGQEQAQQYMNPYLQSSLNPQLEEARRQSNISEQQNKAAMTKAGAFGGGRGAILTAENQRNLGTNLAGITGKGYDTAYTNAMGQFNADQARNMQAQQASEQSKQFGAGQGMTAAQQAAQYGQAANQASEQSRQFGADLGLKGLQTGLQAAQTQGNLANIGATAGQSALKTGMELGGVQQALDQAKINAPLTTATNAAQLLRGFTVPTGTSQEYKGPLPGAYAASPLSQIAGLGTLFASSAGGQSAAQGLLKALRGSGDNSNNTSADPTSGFDLSNALPAPTAQEIADYAASLGDFEG
jgi:hypothetical protein